MAYVGRTKNAKSLICRICDKEQVVAEFRLKKKLSRDKTKTYTFYERGCRSCRNKQRSREKNKIRGHPPLRWILDCIYCKQTFLTKRRSTHKQKFCSPVCERIHNRKSYSGPRKIGRQLTLLAICNKCGLHPPTEKYGGGPRCIKCHKEAKRERFARHRENDTDWYKNNAAYRKQWKKDNPESTKQSRRNRRVREKGILGMLTEPQWGDILAAWGNQCAYCDVTLVQQDTYHPQLATRDHVIPITHPDCTDTPSNIVPACVMCNSTKNTQKLADVVGEERYKLVQFMLEYQPRIC